MPPGLRRRKATAARRAAGGLRIPAAGRHGSRSRPVSLPETKPAPITTGSVAAEPGYRPAPPPLTFAARRRRAGAEAPARA